ncbi:hypothetical protein, variant 1 [Aphanomyces astaci]|uniref:Uncharacterized protein n=2 Tax=Aphanomyces astaci TaxID=112090 RepID=W4FDE1_APHAT|nr:hypothetical protein, variant 1 [Aphanomyces astaci]ETV65497.1 hypothetical protein, variant 1 [Aphanomyces astaci]|eukprot:XP_009844985.1 hypothetical protein, variant 1 [Aphanomyces astaci]
MVSGRIRGNPTSSGALRSPVMPTKGAETNGLQPWGTRCLGHGRDDTSHHVHEGGQETADNGPSTSVDSTAVVRGPVASSSDDESEFVPSTTLLDNGILHIRGKGALGNRVTSSTTPATPLKRKYNNIKKVQKRKMLDSAQSTTPDTKRTKATSSYGPTNGYSKKVWASDSDDTEARGKKDAAAMLHEDWAWKEIDQDYMRLPSRKQMLYIHTLQQDACRTVVSNLGDLHGADNDSLVQPIMDARMCHIDGIAAAASSPLERPRRGRYYKDIWADVDYLDALKTSATHDTSEFETYTSNHDLVARYDDDAYEQFVHRLEGHPTDPRIRQHAKLGHDHHPAASLQTSATSCVTQPCQSHSASWGGTACLDPPPEADEVSAALDMCIKALVPQSAANFHALGHVCDRVANEAQLEPIFHQERRVAADIERYYQRWKAGVDIELRGASVLSAWREALWSQDFTPTQIRAVEFAVRFATTLQRGDGVDFLDHTGQWEPGFVVDVFVESADVLSHAKIQLLQHGAVSQEWCCVFSGRLMPPGTNTRRTAVALDVKIHPAPHAVQPPSVGGHLKRVTAVASTASSSSSHPNTPDARTKHES